MTAAVQALGLWLGPITVKLTADRQARCRRPCRCHASLTCPSDAAAPLTASRAEAMAGGTAAVLPLLLLLLLTGSLALYWQRQANTFTHTPDATVLATSLTRCALRCAGTEPWSCGGFTYLNTTGACHLYRDSRIATCAAVTGEDIRPGPVSYRLRQYLTCTGEVGSEWRRKRRRRGMGRISNTPQFKE